MAENKKLSFTDEDYSQMASALRLQSLNDDIKQRIQDVLADMLKWSCAVIYQKSAPDRKKLERIYKSAKSLRAELSDVLFSLRIVDGGEYENLCKQLSAIERRSDGELKTYVKKKGRKTENWPLRLLIGGLAEIYKDASGNNPTLSKQIDNRPSGFFYEFVFSFISAAGIQYHSEFSLSAIIEDVIYSQK